jgi:L-ascorbate metabolism protein UlaG (beta-lactamase superfamily)
MARLPWNRPDLGAFAQWFDLPVASGAFAVTFLGVASLLIDDGETQVLTDGFFSRPGLRAVALGRIAPDPACIDQGLARAGGDRVRAVVPVHSHFDHALDSAFVATKTGAMLLGGQSTANLGRGGGLPQGQIRTVADGDAVSVGAFTLTFVSSRHCPPDRFPGVISAPVVPPAKASAYKCGEAWSIVIRHSGGRRMLVQGSAGYVENALADHSAEVVYLGVGQLGKRDDEYIRRYWEHTVRAVGAKEVVLIHWDDFFRPLDPPLRALPYAGDDLNATMRMLTGLADTDGVRLHFPTVWQRQDPWAVPDPR